MDETRVARIEKGTARQAAAMRKLSKEQKEVEKQIGIVVQTIQNELISARRFQKFMVCILFVYTFALPLILK